MKYPFAISVLTVSLLCISAHFVPGESVFETVIIPFLCYAIGIKVQQYAYGELIKNTCNDMKEVVELYRKEKEAFIRSVEQKLQAIKSQIN